MYIDWDRCSYNLKLKLLNKDGSPAPGANPGVTSINTPGENIIRRITFYIGGRFGSLFFNYSSTRLLTDTASL
jgi:hypothetical protein